MPELIEPNLVELITKNAEKLVFPEVFVVDDTLEPCDKQIFLAAVSLNESSGGWNNKTRFEKIYAPGGKYYRTSALQRCLYEQYGDDACMSYSSFQIMFLNFHDLGFTNATPDNAKRDSYAIEVAIKYFNKRIFKNGTANDCNFIGLAGDAYNSGNWKDKNVPMEYITRLIKHYHLAWDSNLFVPTVDKNAPKPW